MIALTFGVTSPQRKETNPTKISAPTNALVNSDVSFVNEDNYYVSIDASYPVYDALADSIERLVNYSLVASNAFGISISVF